MIEVFKQWFHRYFSDPEAVLLLVLLSVGFGAILMMGQILAPVLASIVIAYLLQTWVKFLSRLRIKEKYAVWIAYLCFLSVFLIFFLVLMPMAWRQSLNLFNDLPGMVNKVQTMLSSLPEQFPGYISQNQLQAFLKGIMQDFHKWGTLILSASLSSIPALVVWIIYLILVPLMVFFFLKDRKKITNWFVAYLPQKNVLLKRLWQEIDSQIGNYVNGKATEIVIVAIASYAIFFYFKLKYSVLLAALVGLSVIIPYVGATVVTVPVVIVAYLQFGFTEEFVWLVGSYFVVQAMDGSVLVPLLFSEAVNLHPLAIIVAILVFGGFWGFWGVFFAIPLATLVKAVLDAWPRHAGL